MILVNIQDDIAIMSLKNETKLNVSNAQDVKAKLNELLDQEIRKIIFDFSGILFIDSSGFAVIISFFNKAKEKKYQFKFCNVTAEVNELLEVTKLNTILEVYNSVEDCGNAFK